MERVAEFGGGWTEEKLERLEKYLEAYSRIFNRNRKARFYNTLYVDAFAGSGYIRRTGTSDPQRNIFEEPDAPEINQYIEGSAVRALGVEPGFGRYVFIERNSARCEELQKLSSKFPGKNICVKNDDANHYLQKWCGETDWGRTRAVVFLDPYGMEVEWKSIEAIARTKAIDLWFLFPLGIGIMRLLTSTEPPPEAWAKVLTRALGTDEWKNRFYPHKQQETLFGPEDTQPRTVEAETVGEYFLERLRKVFADVAKRPLVLRNSRNSPLYLFCFAAGNPKAAPLAVKIAQDILGK